MADSRGHVSSPARPGFLRGRLARLREHGEARRALANTSWLLGEHALRWAFGFLVAILVARYLGPPLYGEYRLAIAIIGFVTPICAVGLSSIISKQILVAPERQDEVLGTAFLLRLGACLLAVPLVVTAAGALDLGGGPSLPLFVAILSAANLFTALRVIDFWFEARVLSKYVVVARSAAVIAAGGAKLGLVLAEAPLVAFVLAAGAETVLVGLGALVGYRICGQHVSRWRFRPGTARRLLANSWPLLLSGFTAAVYLKVDQIMLGAMISADAVGVYAVAASLSELWYLVPNALAASVYPGLLRARQASAETYARSLQRLYRLLALGALAIAIPVALAATPLVTLLYGEPYAGAGPILQIHIWAGVFIFMRALLSKWLIIEDLYLFSLVSHGAGAVANVLLNVILIPRFGGEGAALATVVSYATASYFSLFLSRRTRPAAMMMTRALGWPVQTAAGRAYGLIRRPRTG